MDASIPPNLARHLKAGAAHAVLTAKLRNRYAVLGLLEYRQELAVGKT
ncbi:hypothetical protein Q672_13190 [Marinobacter sp. EVN1]|nr:hypothetical protein Q672_13190 [Marinobacter sp. EVN1]